MGDQAAPIFNIPSRKLVAVEHPMIIMNLDNGIQTFGSNLPFERVSHHTSSKIRAVKPKNDKVKVRQT